MIILQVVQCMIVAHLGVQIMMPEDRLQEILASVHYYHLSTVIWISDID